MLTARGARSGQPRSTPVLYFSDADDVVLIASSFGRERHPAWYHNLRAHPDASLRVGRHHGHYRAREAEGEQRERLWSLANRVYPGFDDYQRRASHRRIPVVVLSPVGTSSSAHAG
jgi:deazaflavin-dependent oxidoreductase (nitroreductase family)